MNKDIFPVENIPLELKTYKQWVLYKITADKRKLPLSITGKSASTTDPNDWSSFDDCLNAYTEGGYDGLGFVFTKADPFCGVDLDHCIVNNKFNQETLKIINNLKSYTEISPSGDGLHIIAKAKLSGSGINTKEVEIYDQGRYFTITGKLHQDYQDIRIVDRQSEIENIYNGICKNSTKNDKKTNFDRGELLAGKDVPEGERDTTLYKYACSVVSRGLHEFNEILTLCLKLNNSWTNPLTEKEVHEKVKSALKHKKIASKPWEVVPADQWAFAEQEKINPIIRGLFDSGDKIAIIGKSKARKSFFTLQLAIRLASEESKNELIGSNFFLKYLIPKPRKVLLVQFEIKKAHFQKRLKRMLKGLFLESGSIKDNLFIVNARGNMKNNDELIKEINEIVLKYNIEIVIFDPLYKLLEGDENSVSDMKPTMAMFDTLVNMKISVIYVHHDKKGGTFLSDPTDRGAGSGLLARDYDSAFILSSHASGPDFKVLETVTRNYPSNKNISLLWGQNRFDVSDVNATMETTSDKFNKIKRSDAPKKEDLIKIVDEVFLNSNTKWLSLENFEAELKNHMGISGRQATTYRKRILGFEEELLLKLTGPKVGKGCPLNYLIQTKNIDEYNDWVKNKEKINNNKEKVHNDED